VNAGAKVLRMHDVAATVDALKVWNAVDAATIPAVD
ncbi:dihydropteroate synthase, partial [Escherichia coli]